MVLIIVAVVVVVVVLIVLVIIVVVIVAVVVIIILEMPMVLLVVKGVIVTSCSAHSEEPSHSNKKWEHSNHRLFLLLRCGEETEESDEANPTSRTGH